MGLSQLSIKTRIETLSCRSEGTAVSARLSQLSIKTRIETFPLLHLPQPAFRLSQLSIKTRIETALWTPTNHHSYRFESAIH